MMKNRFLLLIIGILILLGILIGFLLQNRKEIPKMNEVHSHTHSHDEHEEEENRISLPPSRIQDLGIEVKEAGPEELSISLSTRGKIILHPDKLAHILPKVSGVAKETMKNIGDDVKQGEILAIIESREIADIKANYLASLEKERLAVSLFDRENRLYEKKVTSEQDFLNAKSAYEEAKINVQLARQKLHAFGLSEEEINALAVENNPDLRLNEIRSPIDGTVIARHITKGEYIENTMTIYEIADLSRVWIDIGIYPKDLHKVKQGQVVEISLPDRKSVLAKIIYLSPIIQDETITARAVAEMDNPKGTWRPGTFVKVNVATEKVEAPIVIPKEAIQEIEGKDYVFVKIPEGFEKRLVQTGKSDNERIEIVSGLSTGEKYAATKTFLLKADLGKKDAEHEH